MLEYELTDYQKGIDYGVSLMADWMLSMGDLPSEAYKALALKFAKNMKTMKEGSE